MSGTGPAAGGKGDSGSRAALVASGKVSEAVGRVEAELADLWAVPESSSAPPKVRASMLNLVIVAAAGELERLRETTDELTQTHPGRVFLLTLDGRLEPWELKTAASAVCRADGGALICSDRIEMSFGAMVASRAASVVGALALAEVPTIVEAAAGAPAALIDALAPRSDRLVVDSAHTSWSRIAEIARTTTKPIGDRNFVRAYSWRELTARFFDEMPRAARAIRRVEIARTEGGKLEPAALLLGWLASRLGWHFETATRAIDPTGRALEIVRTVDPRTDVGPGEVTAVRLRAELDGAPLELECARCDAPRVVRWIVSGAESKAHEHPLGFRDETWVLVKAIDSTGGDRIYREAARAAAAFVDATGVGARRAP